MATVHFSLGDDAGKLLVDVAREKLLYELNPEAAVSVFTSSLGCDRQLALDILIGRNILTVSEDHLLFNCRRYNIETDKEEFPQLDAYLWMEQKQMEIYKYSKLYLKSLRTLSRKVDRRESITLDITYVELIEELNHYNGKANLSSFDTTGEIHSVQSLYNAIKDFLYAVEQYKTVAIWLHINCNYYEDVPVFNYCLDTTMLQEAFLNVCLNFQIDDYEQSELDKYIAGVKQIDKLNKGMLYKSDILENYSAGWLAPNGDYYGLNGEMANMLHNNLADALVTKGIIRVEGDELYKTNPDVWLEDNGWVKIHGDWILYQGYNKTPIIPLTKEQVEAIYKYGQVCHNGMLKLGYSMMNVSAAKFHSTEKLMLNKYFQL